MSLHEIVELNHFLIWYLFGVEEKPEEVHGQPLTMRLALQAANFPVNTTSHILFSFKAAEMSSLTLVEAML